MSKLCLPTPVVARLAIRNSFFLFVSANKFKLALKLSIT